MNSKSIHSIFLGFLFLSSCLATKPFNPNIKPQDISDVLKFETLSSVTYIEQGNKSIINDSLSKKSKEYFDEVLISGGYVPLTGMVNSKDSILKKRIESEVRKLFVNANFDRRIAELKLTPILDSVLEGNGKRFGLLAMTTGFTRRQGNYGGQVVKGAAVGILTLGMVVPSPVKANSSVAVMIIDAKQNSVSFYKTLTLSDVEPLDKDILRYQLNGLFYGSGTRRRY